jgi:uncharacterized membrane protein
MSSAYVLEWLSLVLRWTHVIAGIAWIGSSFYFIWLDARLNVPPRNPESPDIAGDLWAVHGGGFYHSQKYKVAPAELPEPLHWFKWEAYTTWLTGFALLTVVYYSNAQALLVDPKIADLGASTAVIVSIAIVIAGWLVYDGLCRSGLKGWPFVLIGGALLLGLCYGATHLFSGRGAFMQVGIVIGTIMAANVLFVIIPSQKQLVAAKLAGKAPDPELGLRAKQRSVHNNYLTLPVVFVMISPHYPITYTHGSNWLVLFAIFVGGALVRHFFNLRNQGKLHINRAHARATVATALAVLSVLIFELRPRNVLSHIPRSVSAPAPAFADVDRILQARCLPCHSAKPSHPTAPVAPLGVMFDSPGEISAWAPRIFDRAVVTKTMPLANLTRMTDAERTTIQQWYAAGAPVD